MKTLLFNLIENKLVELSIEKDGNYNCMIKDKEGRIYNGFILAKSTKGKALTICEIDFQKSSTDDRYQPRLTFKKVNKVFEARNVHGNSLQQRISFHRGEDGYREFWQMISFLKGFKDFIDTGDFDNEYKVISKREVVNYFISRQDKKDVDIYSSIIEKIGQNDSFIVHLLTTIKLLQSYRAKIYDFIKNGSSETDVQNWIDEDNHGHRQDRCMIFGLEFVKHTREGEVAGNQYDLLTRMGSESEERVLIELKSPSDDVFISRNRPTINQDKIDYSISNSLARAIPQILEYRKDLEEKRAGDSELQKIGESKEIRIAKCIIIIGANKQDSRWCKNLCELRRSLSASLEIWTYSDLLNKIDSVIQNFERKKIEILN